jgi:5'-methylthioadenosine phosphorylase
MATAYDSSHPRHEAVPDSENIATLTKNAENACRVVAEAVGRMPLTRECKCGYALKHAILKDVRTVQAETRNKLELIEGKYLT